MPHGRQLAGGGGIVFAASLTVGFTLFGPKGGRYSADEIGAFVGQTATSLIASVYLVAASIIGLIVLMAYLSGTMGAGAYRRITWATSVLAAGSFLIGWCLYLTPSTAVLAAGPAPDAALSHTIITAGFVLVFGASGILFGIALVTFALGAGVTAAWARALSGLAGLGAFLSWAFILALGWSPNQWLPAPFYLVVLWGLVMGVWLIVSPSPNALTRTTPPPLR